MILDMNEDGIPDYDPVTQDLYLYSGGAGSTGYPIAWNPDCVVYKYREYLETRGATIRRYGTCVPSYGTPNQNICTPITSETGSQGINFTWISPSYGVWCGHAWGLGFDRIRTTSGDVIYLSDNLIYPFYFINLSDQRIELEKDKILYGWNHLESLDDAPPNAYRRKLPIDYMVFEYSGTKLQNKKFPELVNFSEITPESFDEIFIIDAQGKVLLLDYQNASPAVKQLPKSGDGMNTIGGGNAPVSPNHESRLVLSCKTKKIITLISGDSGSQVYAAKNNIVYFLGHISIAATNGFFVNGGNMLGLTFPRQNWTPDWNYFGLNTNSWNKIAATKKYATQQTASSILDKIDDINQLLTDGA